MPDLYLSFIPFGNLRGAQPATKKVLKYVREGIDAECEPHGACGQAMLTALINKEFAHSTGIFILTDKTKVLATALMTMCVSLTWMWTPPEQRNKGYATELLRRIAQFYEPYKRPVFCPTDPIMEPVAIRAGWQTDKIRGQDATLDYTPKLDEYIKQYTVKGAKPRREGGQDWIALMARNVKHMFAHLEEIEV